MMTSPAHLPGVFQANLGIEQSLRSTYAVLLQAPGVPEVRPRVVGGGGGAGPAGEWIGR